MSNLTTQPVPFVELDYQPDQQTKSWLQKRSALDCAGTSAACRDVRLTELGVFLEMVNEEKALKLAENRGLLDQGYCQLSRRRKLDMICQDR